MVSIFSYVTCRLNTLLCIAIYWQLSCNYSPTYSTVCCLVPVTCIVTSVQLQDRITTVFTRTELCYVDTVYTSLALYWVQTGVMSYSTSNITRLACVGGCSQIIDPDENDLRVFINGVFIALLVELQLSCNLSK